MVCVENNVQIRLLSGPSKASRIGMPMIGLSGHTSLTDSGEELPSCLIDFNLPDYIAVRCRMTKEMR